MTTTDAAPLSNAELMTRVDTVVCLPLSLLMNFALFQYLLGTFFRRRHEPIVRILLGVAFVSFACLVPFSYPDAALVTNLNDISETCSVLTFLLQILILTRDINKKMKLRAMAWLMAAGEILIFLAISILVTNFIDIVAPGTLNFHVVEIMDQAAEGISILYIVAFRFYFLSMARGYRRVLATQKLEIFFYMLFLTHQYPFMLLDHVTGLSWEHVQGVWNRVTIMLCLSTTIKAKLLSRNSRMAGGSSASHGTGQSSFVNNQASTKSRGPTLTPALANSIRSPTSVVPH